MSERLQKRRLFLSFVILVIIMTIVVTGLGFFKFVQIQGLMKLAASGAFVPPPSAVTTTVAQESQWKPTLDTIGSTMAINGVTISTDLAGIVRQIAFESGSRVKAGDLLVQLNTDQEEAELAQAESQEYLAKLNLDRSKGLLVKKTIAQSDYDSTNATYLQAVAMVNQYKALIARKTLRAPFDGVVGIRQVNLGQYLNAGDAVVTLQSFDPIYVNFNLPQQHLSKLATGQEVQVKVDTFGSRLFVGKITAINQLVDVNSRNVQIQATLPNADTKLWPGMYVKVSVVLPNEQKVIAIPSSSIHYAPYGDSVFIVEELKDSKGKTFRGVREQFVKLGQAQGDLVSIVSGLKPGEEVVTSGVFRLKNNVPVIVNNKIQPGSEIAPTPADS
jgi:membrane fusion protein (multidrug efflux system)